MSLNHQVHLHEVNSVDIKRQKIWLTDKLKIYLSLTCVAFVLFLNLTKFDTLLVLKTSTQVNFP